MKIIPLEAHQTLEFWLFITARDGRCDQLLSSTCARSFKVTVNSCCSCPIGGVVSRSASAQTEIVAVGDTKPQFTQRTYRSTIEEERDPGTVIVKVSLSTRWIILFLVTGGVLK